MKAMILAAGLGTRLRPYSRHTPKALFTVNDRPVLGVAIEKLQQAGFEAVIINTHHHHVQIEAFIADSVFSIPVYTRHEVDILGTGGGIRNVADFWKSEDLLVINTDILCDIDPARVYQFHQDHPCPVTMVMHDYAQFNGVHVSADHFVTGFDDEADTHGQHLMAFTGIHVVSRRVLDFLPARGPAHIIDAYRNMIAAGEQIKAYVAEGHRWHDIGTPQSYVSAVYDYMAPMAFETAFGRHDTGPIERRSLQGDGSDRRWYRLVRGKRSLIMADHGIHPQSETGEVDAFVAIGNHLIRRGIAVPRIQMHDRCAGLVFLEDLGDCHLQTIIGGNDSADLLHLYRHVIDQWITMAVEGAKGFDTSWTYQTPFYDEQVVLNNECRYFLEAFLQRYLGWDTAYDHLQPEFGQLSNNIMATEIRGFIHRDFQSRNIMVKDGRAHFIDFQGGRLGPIQYDLASLLIDPYADLPEPVQSELLAYAVEKLQHTRAIDRDLFLQGHWCCAVSRNLQILGAFSFLSRTKGKKQFEVYIPRAVESLNRNLACLKGLTLPKLEKLTSEILQTIDKK